MYLRRSPNQQPQSHRLPSRKSPDEAQLPSRIGGGSQLVAVGLPKHAGTARITTYRIANGIESSQSGFSVANFADCWVSFDSSGLVPNIAVSCVDSRSGNSGQFLVAHHPDRFLPRSDLDLLHDAMNVIPYRKLRQIQLHGDFFVRQSLGDQIH